ncbi:MAG TPA: TonB-dependent receptor [Steroidobacter sp.]|uniref:TonB-dependent receptor n=1 Tax=Steroidobacter sp. TaxID=1978227 RepID=UPI002ED83FE6
MKRFKTIRRARAFSAGATALLSGCLIAAQTQAQSQNASGDSANRNESSASLTLEEVVVTAEKRAEGLQNIPIAITAVSGATLEKAGAKEVGDLVQLTPSLQFGTRSTNVFIALRGIGQAGQDIGSQSGVTVSLDGVPLLNHFMMNPSFLDIERVEVLRGPQGTIQGRNATGGAVNIHSKQPTDELAGEVGLTFGNYSRVGVNAFANAPLADNVMARVSFQSVRADGWLKNAFLDRRNDDTDLTEMRAQLLVQPSDVLSVHALVDYTRDRGDPSFNVLLGRAVADRPTVTEGPTYPYPQNDIENLTVYFSEPNRRDVTDLRAVLNAKLELAPSVSLSSTTGFIDHDIDLEDLDVDLTPYHSAWFPLIGLYAKQLTQEFTVTADLGSRADLVAGVFYMHGNASEPLYLSIAAVENLLVYLPTEKLDSYAGYAQLRYSLTDTLRATLGGRYTIDEKSYDMDATNSGYHFLLSKEDTWKAFTPRFVIDYAPSDMTMFYVSASRGFKSGGYNTLGDITQPVNVFDPEYVWNYEIGAKAILFDRKLRTSLTAFYADYSNLQQTVFRINEQTGVRFPKVDNSAMAVIKGVEYEVEVMPTAGLKLSGAVTYLDGKFDKFCNNNPLYPDVPTDPECVGATANGAPLPPNSINLQDNRLTQAPEWQFNVAGEYAFPISGNLEITARADYKWQDKVYFDIYNNPFNAQDAYGLLNASLAVGTFDKTWSVTGWIRNALDERYISQAVTGSGANAYTAGSIGMPRMYGATLYHRF